MQTLNPKPESLQGSSSQKIPMPALLTYLWLVGNGGMGYNYNYYYYHSSILY